MLEFKALVPHFPVDFAVAGFVNPPARSPYRKENRRSRQ